MIEWRHLVNAYEVRQAWCLLQVKLCDPCLSALKWFVYHARRYTSARLYFFTFNHYTRPPPMCLTDVCMLSVCWQVELIVSFTPSFSASCRLSTNLLLITANSSTMFHLSAAWIVDGRSRILRETGRTRTILR